MLVRAALGTALKFIPGAGSLAGGMINGTVAAATTEMMGQTFIAYLDDNFSNLSEAIKNIGTITQKQYIKIRNFKSLKKAEYAMLRKARKGKK